MPLKRAEFIDHCVAACQASTFVTAKHHPSGITTPWTKDRSINSWDNAQTEAWLRTGDFRVHAYADSDPSHSPEFYVITPNDPSVVPGSGVPGYSTTPSVAWDSFAVPSGQKQGWHAYAYPSSDVVAREAAGTLSLLVELL